MYLPSKDDPLRPSGGAITITKLGDGIAEGTFNVAQAGYGDFVTKTTASGRFRAKLFN